jgi:hypothetical protein
VNLIETDSGRSEIFKKSGNRSRSTQVRPFSPNKSASAGSAEVLPYTRTKHTSSTATTGYRDFFAGRLPPAKRRFSDTEMAVRIEKAGPIEDD